MAEYKAASAFLTPYFQRRRYAIGREIRAYFHLSAINIEICTGRAELFNLTRQTLVGMLDL